MSAPTATDLAPATSPPAWLQLRVLVPTPRADDAAAALVWSGAEGAHIEELGAPDPALAGEAPPPAPTPAPPLAAAERGMARLSAAWRQRAARGTDGELAADALRQRVLAALGEVGVRPAVEALDITACRDGDWAQSWRDHFRPARIGRRLWVVPSWEKDTSRWKDGVAVVIDPGMAFGTGQHATTTLCLQAVERFALSRPAEVRRACGMLDVGCGTGILAIAGARLGLGPVVAEDICPVAVAVARDNARANQVRVEVRASPAQAPTPTPTPAIPFGLVVANILAGPLMAMAGALLAQLRPGGTLVLSGLLDHQAGEVLQIYLDAARAAGHPGLCLARRWGQGEWVALQLSRDPRRQP